MSTSTSPQEIYRRGTDAPVRGLLTAGAILAVVGGIDFVAGIFGADPGRGWRVFLVNFLFFTGLAQGAIIFAAIQKESKGRLKIEDHWDSTLSTGYDA